MRGETVLADLQLSPLQTLNSIHKHLFPLVQLCLLATTSLPWLPPAHFSPTPESVYFFSPAYLPAAALKDLPKSAALHTPVPGAPWAYEWGAGLNRLILYRQEEERLRLWEHEAGQFGRIALNVRCNICKWDSRDTVGREKFTFPECSPSIQALNSWNVCAAEVKLVSWEQDTEPLSSPHLSLWLQRQPGEPWHQFHQQSAPRGYFKTVPDPSAKLAPESLLRSLWNATERLRNPVQSLQIRDIRDIYLFINSRK